ncbi:hypothetical protein I600_1827 [Maribacter dokdonensis DSW-8]|nr:hypothetical protein I600_1827 [Maribacter dokdonensis DSW-8]
MSYIQKVNKPIMLFLIELYKAKQLWDFYTFVAVFTNDHLAKLTKFRP